ncbi:histidinol dehydrogenase [Alicyclobacillus fastidiosus]|uniref:Histidinol dehydrogenase n=1 Tax=Alicyclobacillus fastidiosus TaxID=392011 RepID=A0ABV5AEJ2_9BACL|nr:histidinol dehydrogenase [Alicyclobacillus fastidiosus]WEH08696.1 histidinol dehydrogenase [Alicyclobacillus fastidiosus]
MSVELVEGEAFAWKRTPSSAPEESLRVAQIIEDVRTRQDEALVHWTEQLDGIERASGEPFDLRVPVSALEAAFAQTPAETIEALRAAAERIRTYHEAQWPEDFTLYGEHGEQMGMVWRAIHRVGVYAPGGRGAYPSTVLMDVIPAQVAGVRSIALASPPGPDGLPHRDVLAAAHLLGIDEVYRIGGAQAVAAFAYGTETVSRVDKIVGPGNLYVALAKRQVMGDVGIDSIAGPSEVFIVADEHANPKFVAADMLAQAEHDTEAGAVCVSTSEKLLSAVQVELARQLADLPRAEIARAALARWGALVHVEHFEQAMDILNDVAPEHVELLMADPDMWLPYISQAGAVFLGHYTPEPVGDYYAGSNHVLPTHGSARYASGLGVHDFLRRMSVVAYNRATLQSHAPHIVTLARAESLEAHARAVLVREEENLDGN